MRYRPSGKTSGHTKKSNASSMTRSHSEARPWLRHDQTLSILWSLQMCRHSKVPELWSALSSSCFLTPIYNSGKTMTKLKVWKTTQNPWSASSRNSMLSASKRNGKRSLSSKVFIRSMWRKNECLFSWLLRRPTWTSISTSRNRVKSRWIKSVF